MRLANWEKRLHDEIASAQKRRFEWGQFDCALFAADCVAASTGINFGDELRGTYSDSTSAESIIETYGGSLEALAIHFLGEPVHPSRAMRGDVVLASIELFDGTIGDALGICMGAQSFAPQARGLRAFRTLDAKMCWRVS